MRTRLLVGIVGVAMGAFGALRFLQRDLDDIVDSVLWLAGGVVVHDLLIAPLTLLLGALGARVLPQGWRARVVLGFVVVATMTITAVPVLGRFGARADNPSLLDRDYTAGWLIVVTLVVVATLVLGRLADRGRRTPPERPADPPASGTG